MSKTNRSGWAVVNQERIVLAITVVIFVAAAVGLPGFLTSGNLVAIVRSIAVLGILRWAWRW